MSKIKFVAISDLHGNLVSLTEPADILLIAGDIIPIKYERRSNGCKKWLKNTFIPWCLAQPVLQVIIVAGNHDDYFERHGDVFREMIKDDKITYLENESVIIPGKNVPGDEYVVYHIYGTPLCKPFGNYSFMAPLDQQKTIFDQYRNETPQAIHDKIFPDDNSAVIRSIVLSHDAPYGCSDIILDKSCKWYDGEHIGNPELRKFIEDSKPNLVIHGHLHTSNHQSEYINDTEVRCVSVVGEDYKVHYDPYYFYL